MTIVATILKQMPAVRQPQAKFLDILFSTILALRGHVTLRNLSRYCDYSERTLARQFRARFDWVTFHRLTWQPVVLPTEVWIAALGELRLLPRAGSKLSGWARFSMAVRGAPNAAWKSLRLRSSMSRSAMP